MPGYKSCTRSWGGARLKIACLCPRFSLPPACTTGLAGRRTRRGTQGFEAVIEKRGSLRRGREGREGRVKRHGREGSGSASIGLFRWSFYITGAWTQSNRASSKMGHVEIIVVEDLQLSIVRAVPDLLQLRCSPILGRAGTGPSASWRIQIE